MVSRCRGLIVVPGRKELTRPTPRSVSCVGRKRLHGSFMNGRFQGPMGSATGCLGYHCLHSVRVSLIESEDKSFIHITIREDATRSWVLAGTTRPASPHVNLDRAVTANVQALHIPQSTGPTPHVLGLSPAPMFPLPSPVSPLSDSSVT